MRRCCRWLPSASYEAPKAASQKMPASTRPAPVMQPMIFRYATNACRPWRQLPEPAQTVSGMIKVITAIIPNILTKESMPR